MPIKQVFKATEQQDAILILSDGDYWAGKGMGVLGRVRGEICFNVAMTGYQETMTDPSYAEQIINFTFPHIGNVGCNDEDMESREVFAKGLVVREPITEPSNYRASSSFYKWLANRGVQGISGVDTRALARNIRNRGPRDCVLHCANPGDEIIIDDIVSALCDGSSVLGNDLAMKVSTTEQYAWREGLYQHGQSGYTVNERGDYHIVAVDYGIKKNILRSLVDHNFKVTVVGSAASFDDIMEHAPDGIFLSNGPGDPFATFPHVRKTIEAILDANIPTFGICLGNQLLALATGLNTLKLHQGHRGSNHPVKNLNTGRVEITSQNHGFCVSGERVPDNVEITHLSLFDDSIEGIRLKDKYAFAIQYHPESSPGPHDSRYLFEDFRKMITAAKAAAGVAARAAAGIAASDKAAKHAGKTA